MALALQGGSDMGAKIDITGERSGLLVAVEYGYLNNDNKAVWLCRCDCGAECYKLATLIKAKKVKSCGCAQKKKRCMICGAEIKDGRGGKVYCSEDCRQKGHLLRSKKSYDKKMETVKKKRVKENTISLLDKRLKQLEAYNKKHGTNLSYGQFVHMLEVQRAKK